MGQAGTPVGIRSFIDPDLGCQWEGVGGQVFDLNGAAISGLVVRVYGNYGGTPVYKEALTGSKPKLGPGGYVIKLGSTPVTPTSRLTIRVFTQTGEPYSYPITFSTGGACDKNLTLVNFKEVGQIFDLMFPLIRR